MTRKHLNIGHLFQLASNTDGAMPRPRTCDPQGYGYMLPKELLADWLIAAYATSNITLSQLSDFLSAIDQCHDEVANVLLAFARAEG